MFSRKKIKEQFMITIPEPCSEDWNKMTVVDRERRHCNSCEKNVVDFTAMSDDEIVLFFQHNKQKTCGRFSQLQLQKKFTSLPETTRPSNWWKAAMLLPLTLFAKNSQAQQNDSIIPTDSVSFKHDSLNLSLEENTDSSLVQSDSLKNGIDSTVVGGNDSTGLPEEPVVATVATITITPGPATMGSIGVEPTIYGGLQQTVLIGDVTIPELKTVGFVSPCYVPLPPTLNFLPLWANYSKRDPNKDDLVSETDMRKVTDPQEPVKEPIPPTIPDSPWYEAILPSSLRPRRNG